MWLIAEYLPTALFSLKPAWATSSGGKSLLLPTPFAVKMALLDAVCRCEGIRAAEQVWPVIRGLTVALRGPERVVVTNTFTKILKPRRGVASPGSADVGPYQKTIGFREYVYHAGPIGIGLELTSEGHGDRISDWLLQINYLGKRGGLVQLLEPPQRLEVLPSGFQVIANERTTPFSVNGTVQPLDDVGAKASFEHVDIYSGKEMRLGKERILHHVVLPYHLVSSSRGYSLYERLDE